MIDAIHHMSRSDALQMASLVTPSVGENHFVGTKACPNTKKDFNDERPIADTNTSKKKNYASGGGKTDCYDKKTKREP